MVAEALAVSGWRLEQVAVAGLHPTRAAEIVVGDDIVGAVGEIDPGVLQDFGIEERVAWLELDLDTLLVQPHDDRPYQLVSRYPSSDIDLAFEVDGPRRPPMSSASSAPPEAISSRASSSSTCSRKVIRSAKVWALGAALLASVPAAAQQAQVGQQSPPPDRYVVGQATPPVDPGSRLLDMTLDEAIQIALEKNLDLKAARLSPQAVDYQLSAARAAFNPRIVTNYQYNNASQPNNSTLEPGLATLSTLRQNYNGAMTQVLPWYGATAGVTFNNNRTATNSRTTVLNPNYGANLQATYTMPLMAGFKTDSNRNTLKTTAIQRQVEDVKLLSTIENTKATVRTAYWNLQQAIEQIEIGSARSTSPTASTRTTGSRSRLARWRRSTRSSPRPRWPPPNSSCWTPRSAGARRNSISSGCS